MNTKTVIALAVGLLGCAAIVADAARVDAASATRSITVHRGAVVERVVTGGGRSAGVAVHRGGAAVRPTPETAPSRSVALRRPSLEISSGETLWLVDRRTGRLIACSIRFTSTVGKEVIRCTKRRSR